MSKYCYYYDNDGYCDIAEDSPSESRGSDGFCDDPQNEVCKCSHYVTKAAFLEWESNQSKGE